MLFCTHREMSVRNLRAFPYHYSSGENVLCFLFTAFHSFVTGLFSFAIGQVTTEVKPCLSQTSVKIVLWLNGDWEVCFLERAFIVFP